MSWDRVERLLGKDNLAHLAAKRVGVIGLGSGGGFVALSLAMSGVGHFTLIDDDVLEATNVVRHVADSALIGRPKAEAVAELIGRRNPQAQITTRVGRLEDHLDLLDDLDLVISGVDGEGPKYVLNQACLDRRLTAVYAGVYERGEGGDVVIIQPHDGPCYACWAAELREGLALTDQGANAELDYGMIGADGTLEAEPGLWLHVVRVASAQADIALNALLRGTDAQQPLPANTVILANRAIEIVAGEVTPPFGAVWVNIARDPHCLVCGDAVRQRIALGDAQDASSAVSLDDLMAETGIVSEEREEDEL
ncbi:MAG: ThiF family adenylyltransferase [Chloroflexi bacterium]|nr:ThiF family adenylyltransferase [Chloroflexota bacterium]